jgi:hypothetical protein
MRNEYQEEKAETDRKIAQLGRRVEAMRPFLCGDLTCKKRQRVAALAGEATEPEPPKKTRKKAEPAEPKDIDPIDQKDMMD